MLRCPWTSATGARGLPGPWFGIGSRRLALALGSCILVALSLGAGAAVAQEEDEEDLSRPTVAEIERSVETHPTSFDFDYDVGIFGGTHLQTGSLGVLADLAAEGVLESRIHRLALGLAYLYDPFSTKTFNFTDEAPVEGSTRLVQWMHELGGDVEWSAEWTKWLATAFRLRSTYRWAELPSDDRWQLELGGKLLLGADWSERGPFGEIAADYFRRIYPDYWVSDRSVDQQGAEGRFGVGYSFGRQAEVGLAYEVRLTDYLDARYDQLGPSGAIIRADESKSYLRHALIAEGVLRPTRRLRLGLRYAYQRNDSRNYDWEISGRNAFGSPEPRFIRDYYDYDRHWFRASVRLRTPFGLDVKVLAGYWLRLFDNYTARDAENRWLDQTRTDHNVELGLEAAYELFEVGDNRFQITASLSHITRRSNMEREVSFATNFDVTRFFLGLEVRN